MATATINLEDYVDFNELLFKKTHSYQALKGKKLNDDGLFLVKYLKPRLLAGDYSTTGKFRSVITDGKKVCSYSPPKSLPLSAIAEESYSSFRLEELVEGTMINLFYDMKSKDWIITTKSGIGGRYKFYAAGKKTFRHMFLEAMVAQGLEFDNFDKDVCYSLVLQHPENRIVVPFSKPQLVLVAMYKFSGFVVSVLDTATCKIANMVYPRSISEFPDYSGNSWTELVQYFNQMNLDYRITGVNVYDPKTGNRYKLRNPTYEYVRRLKGNHSKLQFQYYSLRHCGKVKEFLDYYPEHRREFSAMRESLHHWTHQLWRNYVACYVRKEKPLIEFPKKFTNHMFNLHDIYINDLRTLGHFVSRQVVIMYVSSLEPARLMYSVNYDLRQQHLHQRKADFASKETE